MEAEHARQAERHIGIAGKIEVNLQGVADHADPGDFDGQVPVRQGEDAIGLMGDGVGDDHFLAQAEDEALDADRHVMGIETARLDVVGNFMVAHDRPGDELGKEEDVEREVEDILARFRRAVVDVHLIGDFMEGEEADAERQQQVRVGQRMETQHVQQAVQVEEQEGQVFEGDEQQQVAGDAERQQVSGGNRAPRLFDAQGDKVIDEDGEQQPAQEIPLPHGIEEQAGQREHQVAQLRRRGIIEDEQDRQKEK